MNSSLAFLITVADQPVSRARVAYVSPRTVPDPAVTRIQSVWGLKRKLKERIPYSKARRQYTVSPVTLAAVRSPWNRLHPGCCYARSLCPGSRQLLVNLRILDQHPLRGVALLDLFHGEDSSIPALPGCILLAAITHLPPEEKWLCSAPWKGDCRAILRLIGATGFEPATPCTPYRCATKLRYAPIASIIGQTVPMVNLPCGILARRRQTDGGISNRARQHGRDAGAGRRAVGRADAARGRELPDQRHPLPRAFIRALGPGQAGRRRGQPRTSGCSTTSAAAAIAAGRRRRSPTASWTTQFPIDVFQTGSGTSTNMNANEVIANRATQSRAAAGARSTRTTTSTWARAVQRRDPDRDPRRAPAWRSRSSSIPALEHLRDGAARRRRRSSTTS